MLIYGEKLVREGRWTKWGRGCNFLNVGLGRPNGLGEQIPEGAEMQQAQTQGRA